MMIFRLAPLALVLLATCRSHTTQFRVIKEWKYINFTWPDEETLREATARGEYIPESNLIAGINYYNDYYYLALPRMRAGTPVTLARIPTSGPDHAPPLEPFPSWGMNRAGDCDAFQNVQDMEVDSRGRLWIIDTGRKSTLDRVPVADCPPKLVIFDVDTNTTVTSHVFSEETASRSFNYLYDLVIDEANGGYAYITDNSGRDPGIVVYSRKDDRSWKVRHEKTMRADPQSSEFRINGTRISVAINVAGIALGPKMRGDNRSITVADDRLVYFCPISSTHLYAVTASTLQNRSSANGGRDYEGEVADVGVKGSQTDGMVMTDKGVLYYGLLATSSIARWDSSAPFASAQKVIARDAKYIQWPNSFAFDNSGNIVVLTNNLHKFLYANLDLNEPNFRILLAHTGERSYVLGDEDLVYETAGTSASTSSATSAASSPPPPSSSEGVATTAETATEVQKDHVAIVPTSSGSAVPFSCIAILVNFFVYVS